MKAFAGQKHGRAFACFKFQNSLLPGESLSFLVGSPTAVCRPGAFAEPVTDQETELGQAVYNQLRDKGEMIQSSPLYDSLKPIADAISRVAQPRYNHPFKFFLIHETPPKRIRYARWKRLCSRFIALFCEEHRTVGGYALP